MTGTKTPLVSIHGLWLLIEACPVGEGSGLTSDENQHRKETPMNL